MLRASPGSPLRVLRPLLGAALQAAALRVEALRAAALRAAVLLRAAALRAALLPLPTGSLVKCLRSLARPALQAAALQAAAAPEHPLDPDLISFLENRNRVRQGEHPDFAGLSDPVANAEAFVERQGRTDPQRSAQWARSLQESPVAYGEAVDLSPATVGSGSAAPCSRSLPISSSVRLCS